MRRGGPLFLLAFQVVAWRNNVESKFNESYFNDIGGAVMFIGREKELALLQQDYTGKALMVYGSAVLGKPRSSRKHLRTVNIKRCTLNV